MNVKSKLVSAYINTMSAEREKLSTMKHNPIRNALQIRKQVKRIQAISEAGRDILTTAITDASSTSEVVDKNNFKTYESKVAGCYSFYDNVVDYGGEVFGSVADFRCSFIAGEGVSFISKNKAKSDFIRTFLDENKLSGSRLLSAVRMGEFEGKILFVLAADKNVKTIKARLFSWYQNRYNIEKDDRDYDQINKITYRKTNSAQEEELKDFVYMKLGGAGLFSNESPTKLGKILTQCENVSRALYDLRHNTHLYARVFPTFKTESAQEGKAVIKALEAADWDIGSGYAGTAQVSLLEPTGAASEAIIKDMIQNMRIISSHTGVPVHWLAYPDLMSNRATADNLLEVVNAATKIERLVLIEGMTELINKAIQMAVDKAGYDKGIIDGDFEIRIPLISLASLQQMIDVWEPLRASGMISDFTFRNMLPGIDPDKEEKLIDKQEKDASKKSPLNNNLLDNSLGVLQNKDNSMKKDTGMEEMNVGN